MVFSFKTPTAQSGSITATLIKEVEGGHINTDISELNVVARWSEAAGGLTRR